MSALRDGLGRGGIRLYPAMPYPSYTKMTREDALAIRAYLRTIDPAPDKIKSNQLPFPFDIRSTMIVWNAINFTARSTCAGSVQLSAVEPGTLSCRRARSLRCLPYAKEHHGRRRGLRLSCKAARCKAGTRPISLPILVRASAVGQLTDIVAYLKTGANRYTLASGGMGEEVVHSSSHMTDD